MPVQQLFWKIVDSLNDQQQRIRKFFALIQPENPAHAIFFKTNIFFALVFFVSNIISIDIYNI